MAIKIVDTVTATERVIPMCDMEPMQVGQIIEDTAYRGHYVLRTQSNKYFEVINLTEPGEGYCWSGNCHMKVRLLLPGESITIELSNP